MTVLKIIIICVRKGGTSRSGQIFVFSIVHNLKTVVATGLKQDMANLQSSHYTLWKFRVPPTSGLGVVIASIARDLKSAVLCLNFELLHFR